MLQVNFQPFPKLETKRLILREISANDSKEMFALRSSEINMQYIDRPRAKTETDALNYINVITTALKNNEGITWGIALKDDNKLIGTIGYWRMEKENYRAEIGYMLSHEFHKKGLMQEAIEVVLDYGFNVMQLHSVEANINPLNLASTKILEKNRFVLEAHFKENYYYNGKFLDSYVYSLLTPNK
jgi:ribosomal-protein-alanine N-acetyltransferase